MSEYSKRLTIQQAQTNQPWAVPYSAGVEQAAGQRDAGAPVPHILGSHCVLHAVKSLGKIAAVYEWRDHHDDKRYEPANWTGLRIEHKAEIRKMAADLLTAALRFANLEGFDLAEALVERVREKNGTDFGPLIQVHAGNAGCVCANGPTPSGNGLVCEACGAWL